MENQIINALPYYMNTRGLRDFLQNLPRTLLELDNLASDIFGERTMIKRDEALFQAIVTAVSSMDPMRHSNQNIREILFVQEAKKYKEKKEWEDYYSNNVTRADVSRNRDPRDAQEFTTKTRDGKQEYFTQLNMQHTNFSQCVKDDYEKLLRLNQI